MDTLRGTSQRGRLDLGTRQGQIGAALIRRDARSFDRPPLFRSPPALSITVSWRPWAVSRLAPIPLLHHDRLTTAGPAASHCTSTTTPRSTHHGPISAPRGSRR